MNSGLHSDADARNCMQMRPYLISAGFKLVTVLSYNTGVKAVPSAWSNSGFAGYSKVRINRISSTGIYMPRQTDVVILVVTLSRDVARGEMSHADDKYR